MEIVIRQVITNRDLRRFVKFPFRLYSGNEFWCPPLIHDELNTLRKDKNPSFEYCEAEYWIAYRNNEPVGRIAGIINHKANEHWNEKLVRFSWVDFVDDIEVTRKLIETVGNWGREHGMIGIHGPLGFTDMDPEGMLIEGFDEPSGFSAIYNYPYYPEHMKALGFEKATDWVQFEIYVPKEIPEKVIRTSRIITEKYNLRILKFKKAKDILPYAPKMFHMLNEAFIELYGFAPLTKRQMDEYTKQYFGFIRPEFISLVADKNDDIVAFGITMPSLTKAIKKCNGKLFPFGYIHLWKAIRKNDIIHMYLIGVRPDYQGKGVLGLVYNDLSKAYIDYKIKKAITHPQLEENLKAISIWKNYEGRIHIRRRCWIRHW